eukprot:TRINITY_DN46951_c0_g1_i1.p1 TRINITY_DN46951_c0_g1~~TRINITY_DN46951_c0_g1_i1.p1  ORF type:complete len:209 (+),score=9.28 TRINITY_DN46951_c0_g1_i1:52-627(+)
MGAIAAISRHMRGKRHHHQSPQQNSTALTALFERFDADASGALDRGELKALLTFLNDGIPPSDSELQFVLYNGDKADGEIDNLLSLAELYPALEAFQIVQNHRSDLEAIYAKYDTDHSGRLEEHELACVLHDLSPSHRPSSAEVKEILVLADQSDGVIDGGVDPAEFTTALTLWNKHTGRHTHNPQCCTIM